MVANEEEVIKWRFKNRHGISLFSILETVPLSFPTQSELLAFNSPLLSLNLSCFCFHPENDVKPA
jgi:hypothetical protein